MRNARRAYQLISFAILSLSGGGEALCQDGWDVGPSVGYELNSEAFLLGVRVAQPFRKESWLGDRIQWEGTAVLTDAGHHGTLVVTSQYFLAKRNDKPTWTAGYGFGSILTDPISDTAGLLGISSTLIRPMSADMDAYLSASAWVVQNARPLVQVLVGISK